MHQQYIQQSLQCQSRQPPPWSGTASISFFGTCLEAPEHDAAIKSVEDKLKVRTFGGSDDAGETAVQELQHGEHVQAWMRA